jgi:hypothetical protein
MAHEFGLRYPPRIGGNDMGTLTGAELVAIIGALTALFVAATNLIKLFQVAKTTAETHATIKTVEANTNGQLSTLLNKVSALSAVQATPAELDARPPGTTPVPVSVPAFVPEVPKP